MPIIIFILGLLCVLLPPLSLALVELEGDNFIAQWPANEPSLKLYAKGNDGLTIRTEDFWSWDIVGLKETSGCSCCATSFLGQPALNCTSPEAVTGPFIDLRNQTWVVEELIPRKKFRWTTADFAGDAVLTIIFEAIPKNSTDLTITNGMSNRTLELRDISARYSLRISNYSPVTFNITEEPDRYFTLTWTNRYYLARPVLPGPLFEVFHFDGLPKQYQVPFKMRSRDEPVLTLHFVQTTFTVQQPPSFSQELAEEEEWGFEHTNAVAGPNLLVDGELVGKDIDIIFAGSENIFFDPDISIVFSEGKDEEEEKDDNDSDALIPALSVTAAVLGLILFAVGGGLLWWRHKKKRATRRNVVNFS
ncbi:hypothetical protein QOT17_016232 [Balamuthia mandrillaris]